MAIALYQQVYENLRSGIREGRYAVGERLPSEAELTELFRVSTITLKRALDILRDEGYIVRRPRLGTFVVSDVPTAVATPRTFAHPLVGCVVTSFDDTFGTRVLDGMLDASARRMSLILKRSQGDSVFEDELVRNLVESGVLGVIVQPSSSIYLPPAVLELVSRHFPVVILDRDYAGVPVTAVCSDNVEGAKQLTEHLFDRGHRRIGLVTSAGTVSTIEDRRAGYMQAHAEFHVPHLTEDEFRLVRSTIPGSDVPRRHDIDALAAFVREHRDLTAFVVTEYNIAVLLREACVELGLDVPGDVSIACFDHAESAGVAEVFRFTHIRQDQQRMGELAVEHLLEQLRAPERVRKALVPTELVPGVSVAAPREVPAH